MAPKSIKDVRQLTRNLRAAAAQSRKILPPPAGSSTPSASLLPSPIVLRRQGL